VISGAASGALFAYRSRCRIGRRASIRVVSQPHFVGPAPLACGAASRCQNHAVGVELFHWNPHRPRTRHRLVRKVWRATAPVNNFGDLLGPLIAKRMLARQHINPARATRDARLLTVGSVLHFARDGDVIWGSGVNGKAPPNVYQFRTLDVRAVRGPLTLQFLRNRGIDSPEVYGDPALLLPLLLPELQAAAAEKRHALTVVPNLNDRGRFGRRKVMDPRTPVATALTRIVQSEFVAASSLHALIVAEAFGIPARALTSHTEPDFKYIDYYRATGRDTFTRAHSVAEAIRLGGEPPLTWDPQPLIDAFPYDLWR